MAAVGKFDSSKTRVAPVFDALLDLDSSGAGWLPPLLRLPRADGESGCECRVDDAKIERHAWHGNPRERRLDPPVSVLAFLLRTLFGSRRTSDIPKRQALFDGDSIVLAEGFQLLEERGYVRRAWWIFEGQTSVDAYLETDRALVLIEGKRTERGDTSYTTYMPGRNQMLRNIDAAWDIRGEKCIAAFYIVEGRPPDPTAVPERWKQIARNTICPDTLAAALPHRSEEQRAAMARAFCGVTTWHAVVKAVGLPPEVLPP
jgi:hypothetical protein